MNSVVFKPNVDIELRFQYITRLKRQTIKFSTRYCYAAASSWKHRCWHAPKPALKWTLGWQPPPWCQHWGALLRQWPRRQWPPRHVWLESQRQRPVGQQQTALVWPASPLRGVCRVRSADRARIGHGVAVHQRWAGESGDASEFCAVCWGAAFGCVDWGAGCLAPSLPSSSGMPHCTPKTVCHQCCCPARALADVEAFLLGPTCS